MQSRLMDRFHRGFVYTCLGLTAYGGYLLSYRFYRFFTVIQPEKRAYEQKMLEHGANSSASDDAAPQIKA